MLPSPQPTLPQPRAPEGATPVIKKAVALALLNDSGSISGAEFTCCVQALLGPTQARNKKTITDLNETCVAGLERLVVDKDLREQVAARALVPEDLEENALS